MILFFSFYSVGYILIKLIITIILQRFIGIKIIQIFKVENGFRYLIGM